ncbi:hypothetical protein ACWCQK_26640 [Streptomyces sp. NPDC002306]
MLKMTWVLSGQHVDEWTGGDFDEAVRAFRLDATETLHGLGMDAARESVFFENFIDPIGALLAERGRAAVESGNEWSTSIGPILVHVAPAGHA